MSTVTVSFESDPGLDLVAILEGCGGGWIETGFAETAPGEYTWSVELSPRQRQTAIAVKFYDPTVGSSPVTVALTESHFQDGGGSTAGVPRWIGPKRIYAVQNQTLAVTSNPRAATGDFTFGVNPSDADTMPAINGFSTLVFKTVAIAFPDIQIGIDLPATLATLAGELEANKGGVGNELLADLTFTSDATHLLIAQTTAGVGGNATTLGASTANIVRSGAALTGGNDGGDFTVTYNSVESNTIQYNDNAAAVEAAIEAIPALTGHATVTGDMPTSSIALDSTITAPLLFVLGTNNLVDGSGAGAVDIYVTDANQVFPLYSALAGEIILDAFVRVVEPFGTAQGPAKLLIGDESSWQTDDIDVSAAEDEPPNVGVSSNVPRLATIANTILGNQTGSLPALVLQDFTVQGHIEKGGGAFNTTGIVDVFVCVATPAPAPA